MQLRIPADVEYYTVRGPLNHTRARIPSGELTPVADPIARLTRECSALRLRLATAERLIGTRTSSSPYRRRPAPPLPLDSAHAPRPSARSDAMSMKLAERFKVLEQTLRDMQATLRTKDKEIDALRRERDRLLAERELHRAQSRTPPPRPDRQQRPREPSRSRAPLRRPDEPQPLPPPIPPLPRMSLDAEHAAHAHSLDVFLTKTDNWSGAQIIQAVKDLNAEISQFAASATESCAFSLNKHGAGTDKTRAQLELLVDTAPWLGAPLVRTLATHDHAQDPILVQLALQTSIATCCARSLSLFCVGFSAKLDALLSRVLVHLQASEPQATSARWRALTHRAIRMLYPGLEEYAVTELVTTMLRWSAAVFALSGSDASVSAGAGAGTKPSPALHTLGSQLRRIAEATCKLSRITREDILSTAFEVVFVESGDAFERARMVSKMRDYGAEEHAGASVGARVICTTELGLRCVTRKDNRAISAGEGPGADELFHSRMLLPPKVVLDSDMEAIERG